MKSSLRVACALFCICGMFFLTGVPDSEESGRISDRYEAKSHDKATFPGFDWERTVTFEADRVSPASQRPGEESEAPIAIVEGEELAKLKLESGEAYFRQLQRLQRGPEHEGDAAAVNDPEQRKQQAREQIKVRLLKHLESAS